MIRKIFLGFLTAIMSGFCVFGIVACGNNNDKNGGTNNDSEHIHEYGEWVTDKNYHWHECKNDDCDEKIKDKEEHCDTTDDGKCNACGYVVDEIKGSLLSFKLLDNGTYAISKANQSIAGNIIIPSTYKKASVTRIGTGALGFFAFENCSNITSLTIPDSITYIDGGSFFGCNGLESITIPFLGSRKDGTGRTHFGHLFANYTADKFNAYVPSSLQTVTVTGGTIIDDEAFRYCGNITTINLPDSITIIYSSAFRDCTALTNITIPASVTEIRGYAFYNCPNLTQIKFVGTTAQWEAIKKSNKAIPDGATVICLGD